jgi:tetratricopeptide (TPR) repeat protein
MQSLVDRAREMAISNNWGNSAYKINMAILKRDKNNCAAFKRVAKYYRLNDKVAEAKSMYLKALEIDPTNRGALLNLENMEIDQKETDAVNEIKTVKECLKQGQSSMKKGHYNLAAKLYSKAYSIEPLLVHAVSLAVAYKRMGNDDKIEKLYSQLIESNQVQSDVNAINSEFKAFGLKMG